MKSAMDSKAQFVAALVGLARELPPAARSALVSALESDGRQDLSPLAVTPSMKERLRELEELRDAQSEITEPAMALALRAAAEASASVDDEKSAEIAWTGPGTDAPLRRVDQVIYDLVETAREEIVVVTYAAYRAERALQCLRSATERGVAVRIIIELAEASGGKISADGLATFRASVPRAEVFYWPLTSRRNLGDSNLYGAMHAKCVVADRSRALVSSANMTDHALELNMELGVLVGRGLAAQLATHFDQLILRGELSLVP
jgi:phosphatidylserine/phosphatidylglycerophosphate/cardiolipin synthase-like enzyme